MDEKLKEFPPHIIEAPKPPEQVVVGGITVISHEAPEDYALSLLLKGLNDESRMRLVSRNITVALFAGASFQSGWRGIFAKEFQFHLSYRINWHPMFEFLSPTSKQTTIDQYHSKSHAYYLRHAFAHLPEAIRENVCDRIIWPSLTFPTPEVIDFVLGEFGPEGRLGLHEPGSSFRSQTDIVELSDSILEEINPFGTIFGNNPPTHAITLGLGDIAKGREVIIAANGESQTPAVLRAIFDTPSTDCPAGILQHMAAADKKVTVVVSPDIFAAI